MPTNHDNQPMTNEPINWKEIRELTRLLATDTYHWAYNQIAKNVLGRLRRHNPRTILGFHGLEHTVQGTLERLEALGWPDHAKYNYLAAIIDNEYEADFVERLQKVWDNEFVHTGYTEEYRNYRLQAFQRNYPYLSRFLETTLTL